MFFVKILVKLILVFFFDEFVKNLIFYVFYFGLILFIVFGILLKDF